MGIERIDHAGEFIREQASTGLSRTGTVDTEEADQPEMRGIPRLNNRLLSSGQGKERIP